MKVRVKVAMRTAEKTLAQAVEKAGRMYIRRQTNREIRARRQTKVAAGVRLRPVSYRPTFSEKEFMATASPTSFSGAPQMRWVFGISLPLAIAGFLMFPFHLKAFILALAGGAIYALPFVLEIRSRERSDAARFLAMVFGGVFCEFSAKSYPHSESSASYYVLVAFAIATAMGSGAAVLFNARRKHG